MGWVVLLLLTALICFPLQNYVAQPIRWQAYLTPTIYAYYGLSLPPIEEGPKRNPFSG